MTWWIKHESFFYGDVTYGPLSSLEHAMDVARSMGTLRGTTKPHLTTKDPR